LANKQVQQHNRKFGTREEPKYDKRIYTRVLDRSKQVKQYGRKLANKQVKQTSETPQQNIGQQRSETT